jgi:hypothetical protein
MGSTRIEAPKIEPVDVGESITQAAEGYRLAAPDIKAAEETLRPVMQRLALEDAQTALLGGAGRRVAEEAQRALEIAEQSKVRQIAAIEQEIDGLKTGTFEDTGASQYGGEGEFDPEAQRRTWQSEIVEAKARKQAAADTYQEASNASRAARGQWQRDNPDAPSSDWKKSQEYADDKIILDGARFDKNKVYKDEDKRIRTLEEQSALDDANITSAAKRKFATDTNQKIADLALDVRNYGESGQFNDAEIQRLTDAVETANTAAGNEPMGMLELAETAVTRQAEVGERLKEAAAKNEFATIQELAPELVDMYREADPGSVNLADLAADKAETMINRPEMGYSEQQEALKDLRTRVEGTVPGGPLGGEVEWETRRMLGQRQLTTPTPAMQQVRDQVANLIGGPAASAAEQALVTAGTAAPGGAAQADALTALGTALTQATRPADPSAMETALGTAAGQQLGATQRQADAGEMAIRDAAKALLGREAGGPSAVQRDIEAQALRDIGTGVRGASTTEQALRDAATAGLKADQRAAGEGEQALTQAGLNLLKQQAGEPSGVQSAMADAAIRDMGAGVRGASPLETALGVSGMRGMDAQARGASDVERALGLSAMRGMDAQQRAASPEEAALQARISELIGGAGTLSPLEQRQVEQEMLALQQRQGRARDTGAAAAVTGRMAEARRADLAQDLAQASALLGQQDALTQARIQEQMQARAMGQQGAVSAAGLEAARQDEMLRQQALGQQGVLGAAGLEATRQEEMLRQRALGQQAGVSAEQMDIARAQQLAAERQAGAQFLGEAESLEQARIQEALQQRGMGQQAAAQTIGQEAVRQQELLRRQAQGMQAGMTAEQMELARQQQDIAAAQAGAGMVAGADALEQARFQQFMAQQQAGAGMAGTAAQMEQQRQAALVAQMGLGAQALGQAAGFGLQGRAQQLGALEAAGQQQAQRQAQRLQGVGMAGDIAGQQFGQMAAARDLQMRQLGMGANIAGDLAAQQRQQQALLSGILGQETSAEQQRIQTNIQREQQGLGALGGAFGMSKAVGPDVGAFFGRPASQAEGLGVLGMGQQQAQYGATPQAADYGQGVNIAMAQQANQAELDAAAIGASGRAQGGLMGGVGNILGSFAGSKTGAGLIGEGISAIGTAAKALPFVCWVAREVYGQHNPMWLLFRGWLLDEAPSWFRNLYIKHGERFAAFIRNKPFIKKLIGKWMTSIVRKYYG